MHLPFYDFRVILSFFTALLSVFFIGYCLIKGRKTKLLYSYILLQIITAVWTAGRVWELMATTEQSWLWAILLSYLAMCYVGFCWLLFCGLYSGNRLITKKRNIYLLSIPPSFSYICLLTNDYHHLFGPSIWKAVGLVYWFHISSTYLYVLYGMIIIIKYAAIQMKDSRKQSILLIFSALIPLLADIPSELQIISQNGLVKLQNIDIVPYSLSFSLLIFWIVSFKYRFLNIIPVAWQKIMNHMKESIMIIDRTDTIVNYNHSFVENFPEFIQTGTGDLNTFAAQLGRRSDDCGQSNLMIDAIKHGTVNALYGELTLVTPEWKCFSVQIQSLQSKYGELQGRIVLFNEVTNYKKLLQELTCANEQLKSHVQTVEELTLEKERNRFARDVHDSLGRNITISLALLEACNIIYDQDPSAVKEKLAEAIEITRKGLGELRSSIFDLASRKLTLNNLTKAIQDLILEYQVSGMNVDFSIKGESNCQDLRYFDVIYRVCQEALTNSLRHGNAKNVSIIIKLTDNRIVTSIMDDGRGSSSIQKGLGLTNMEQRVENLNGNIRYGSNGEHGFKINVEIPLKELS